MALQRRQPHHVTHHSDQGSQYTSTAFTKRCQAHRVDISMGSVGDCFDNAMAASFFATLETELLAPMGPLRSTEDAKRQVFGFIEGFYNTRRLHSALNDQSPCEFEAALSTVNQHEIHKLPVSPLPIPSTLPDRECLRATAYINYELSTESGQVHPKHGSSDEARRWRRAEQNHAHLITSSTNRVYHRSPTGYAKRPLRAPRSG